MAVANWRQDCEVRFGRLGLIDTMDEVFVTVPA
jgi:hypothetical protein